MPEALRDSPFINHTSWYLSQHFDKTWLPEQKALGGTQALAARHAN